MYQERATVLFNLFHSRQIAVLPILVPVPGQVPVQFDEFSGYVLVDFWFVQSVMSFGRIHQFVLVLFIATLLFVVEDVANLLKRLLKAAALRETLFE